MVTRVHCDICDEYELPVGRRRYHVGYLPKEAAPNRDPVYVDFDLCFECEVEILRFMLRDHLKNDIHFQERLVKVIRGKIEAGKKERSKSFNGLLDYHQDNGAEDERNDTFQSSVSSNVQSRSEEGSSGAEIPDY